MKKISFLCGLLYLAFNGIAQAQNTRFIDEGIIQYQMKVNSYPIIKIFLEPWGVVGDQMLEEYKKNNVQFQSFETKLIFKKQESLYQNGIKISARENNTKIPLLQNKKVIYQNLAKKEIILASDIGSESYLLQDSTPAIKWRYTDETRDIAGFTCKRANGLILDSVYVIAFYAEQILSKQGPSIFHGLPGMILGVVIPDQHVSWFATKVSDIAIPENQVNITEKGTLIQRKKYNERYDEYLNGNTPSGKSRSYRKLNNAF